VTASDLDFGAYTSQGSSPLTSTTILRATCTPGSTYNIGLSDGTGGGTIYSGRKMASGQNKLNYQLYRDSARTNIWGNTTGTDTVQDVGTGLAKDHTVFGTIPAAQVVPSGDYADTITVRVSY
jgi:spore coat protein U-like protein